MLGTVYVNIFVLRCERKVLHHVVMLHSDIDECIEELDGCDQICTNTDGSYYCTCMDGYELESDNQTCTGDDYYTNYIYYIKYVRICVRTSINQKKI